jgi:hypothetical protein
MSLSHGRNERFALSLTAVLVGVVLLGTLSAIGATAPSQWLSEWPTTDFSRSTIDFNSVRSGGPPKDGIPAIDDPKFEVASEIDNLEDREPVILVEAGGQTKAYPLRVLIWHEIVNDMIGSEPVTVTYCPLCNAAIAFSRRVDGDVLSFGTTGKLRNSDLIMYDRQTESWWQQYTGNAIVGVMAEKTLTAIPSRIVPWAVFLSMHPKAPVLVPNNPRARSYGSNPYVGYETSGAPFLFDGELPRGIKPMQRVVVVGERAWSLEFLQKQKIVQDDALVIRWVPGQASALHTRRIADGKDVGTVSVQRLVDGALVDVHHKVTFAFVFHAFNPDGAMITD